MAEKFPGHGRLDAVQKAHDFPIQILFEDPRFLVVDKPPGWLTIPGRDPAERSLIETLRQTRPGLLVVHRIDRETSGVVLFAKTPDSHRLANGWFEKHEVKKEYLALVRGDPQLPVFKIQLPIEGAKAITQATIEKRFRGCTLLRVRIVTGKRHQIRIHLSGHGHPILGDPTYGGTRLISDGSHELRFERVALHAARLTLPTGETIEAPLPADFEGWLSSLSRYFSERTDFSGVSEGEGG